MADHCGLPKSTFVLPLTQQIATRFCCCWEVLTYHQNWSICLKICTWTQWAACVCRENPETGFALAVVWGKAVQLFHHYFFSQEIGSFNAHLVEGFWGHRLVQRSSLILIIRTTSHSSLKCLRFFCWHWRCWRTKPTLWVWKTKIQFTIDPATSVPVSGNSVDNIESFVYVGLEIHMSGSSEPEVWHRIGLAKSCFSQHSLNMALQQFHFY